MMGQRQLPAEIGEVGFDFHWDEGKVWQLDIPAEELPITDLVWHLDIPFLWTEPDGYYDLTPRSVLEEPERYPGEWARTLRADTKFPIDVMFWKERWVILDGLHRLMKLSVEEASMVVVRKIPRSAIPLIRP